MRAGGDLGNREAAPSPVIHTQSLDQVPLFFPSWVGLGWGGGSLTRVTWHGNVTEVLFLITTETKQKDGDGVSGGLQ